MEIQQSISFGQFWRPWVEQEWTKEYFQNLTGEFMNYIYISIPHLYSELSRQNSHSSLI